MTPVISLPLLPFGLDLLFVFMAIGTVYWLYRASSSKTLLYIGLAWLILQSILGWIGFYQQVDSTPPKVFFGVLPIVLMIIITALTKKGKEWMSTWNLKSLTYLHTVRIPVEIGLFLLFTYGAISKLQTFEGWNFDVSSGISAPIIVYFAFKGNSINKTLLKIWNIVCLLLLINIVVISILSLPVAFQKLSFDQPNLAILYFPYNLLASVIVPSVLLAHIAALVKLSRDE